MCIRDRYHAQPCGFVADRRKVKIATFIGVTHAVKSLLMKRGSDNTCVHFPERHFDYMYVRGLHYFQQYYRELEKYQRYIINVSLIKILWKQTMHNDVKGH